MIYLKIQLITFRYSVVESRAEKNILSQRMTVKTNQNQNRGIHCQ